MQKYGSWYRSCIIHKINVKYIIDLNVKCKTIKFLENIVETLDYLGCGDDFLGTTPKVFYMKEVIIWNLLKLKILLCERQ